VCLSRIPAKNNQPISLKQPKFNGSRALSVGGGMLCQSAVYSYCLFMSPQPILQRRHYVFALSVAALFPPFVPCQTYITNFTAHISFASQEYWTNFRWNSREVITIANRLNDYVFQWTREQDTKENSNRRQSDIKQVLTPSEWIHKLHCTDDGRCDLVRCILLPLISVFITFVLFFLFSGITFVNVSSVSDHCMITIMHIKQPAVSAV